MTEVIFRNDVAEQAALGAALVNEAACAVVVRDLSPEDLYLDRNRRILKAIVECRERGAVDIVTVAAQLNADAEIRGYLHVLAEATTSTANVREHIAIVKDQAERRRLQTALRSAMSALAATNGDGIEHIVEPLREALDSEAASRDSAITLRCLANVTPRKVDWLWPRRIPFGMSTIPFGPTGLGKSHFWQDITTRVSTGAAWPDGRGSAPLGNTVVMSAEDDIETVIVPRLTYAGADLNRVFAFPSVADFDERGRRTFRFHDDADRLETEISRVSAKLAVVDPVTAYLGGANSAKMTEIREVMAIIDDIAHRTGAAIVCIAHPSKNDNAARSAIHRISGSHAFGDAARSVMALVKDPDDDDRRLLLPVKMSVAAKPEGLGFCIVAAGPDTCESAVQWDSDPVTVDADEALSSGFSKADSPEVERAKDYLLAELADGEWKPAKTLIEAAATRGISESTLRRAHKRMKVAWKKSGFQGAYHWRLPRGSA